MSKVDGTDSRNILLLPPLLGTTPPSEKRPRQQFSNAWVSATFDSETIASTLAGFGFDSHAGLSVMAVEMAAKGTASITDPLATDLGRQRILRTSGLTTCPGIC